MILAAGRGERMRPLSDGRPKVMLEVAGRSLIERHLITLATVGVRDVVINLAWRGEAIRGLLGDGSRYGLAIQYSDEGPEALETGGGIVRALPRLGAQPFLVINGDIWTDYDFARLGGEQALAPEDLGHLVLVPTPDYKPRGDFALEAGRVSGGEPRPLTFSGIALYRPAFFEGCEPGRFPLAPMLYRAADRGRLAGSLHPGDWCDVGTPARLEALRRRVGSA